MVAQITAGSWSWEFEFGTCMWLCFGFSHGGNVWELFYGLQGPSTPNALTTNTWYVCGVFGLGYMKFQTSGFTVKNKLHAEDRRMEIGFSTRLKKHSPLWISGLPNHIVLEFVTIVALHTITFLACNRGIFYKFLCNEQKYSINLPVQLVISQLQPLVAPPHDRAMVIVRLARWITQHRSICQTWKTLGHVHHLHLFNNIYIIHCDLQLEIGKSTSLKAVIAWGQGKPVQHASSDATRAKTPSTWRLYCSHNVYTKLLLCTFSVQSPRPSLCSVLWIAKSQSSSCIRNETTWISHGGKRWDA